VIKRVNKQVLRLNVSVDDLESMNVSKSPEELVGIELDLENGNEFLELAVLSKYPKESLRDILHY
jgi:hypothetical protein